MNEIIFWQLLLLRQICYPSCRVFICIFKRCFHVNWKTTAKWSLKYLKCILKISHSKYLQKFAYFLNSSLLINSFFVFPVCKQTFCGWIAKKAINANFSGFVIKTETICLLLHNLHYCVPLSNFISTLLPETLKVGNSSPGWTFWISLSFERSVFLLYRHWMLKGLIIRGKTVI